MSPAEIPGLVDAEAARDAIAGRLAALTSRIQTATQTGEAATEQRKELLRLTVIGEEVAPDEVEGVAATIRGEEAKAALLREALPEVEAELVKADAKVRAALQAAMRVRERAAADAFAAADAAYRDAAEFRMAKANALTAAQHDAQTTMPEAHWRKMLGLSGETVNA